MALEHQTRIKKDRVKRKKSGCTVQCGETTDVNMSVLGVVGLSRVTEKKTDDERNQMRLLRNASSDQHTTSA